MEINHGAVASRVAVQWVFTLHVPCHAVNFFPALNPPHAWIQGSFTEGEGYEQDPHASPFSSTPTPPVRSPYPASTRTGASSKRLQLA